MGIIYLPFDIGDTGSWLMFITGSIFKAISLSDIAAELSETRMKNGSIICVACIIYILSHQLSMHQVRHLLVRAKSTLLVQVSIHTGTYMCMLS